MWIARDKFNDTLHVFDYLPTRGMEVWLKTGGTEIRVTDEFCDKFMSRKPTWWDEPFEVELVAREKKDVSHKKFGDLRKGDKVYTINLDGVARETTISSVKVDGETSLAAISVPHPSNLITNVYTAMAYDERAFGDDNTTLFADKNDFIDEVKSNNEILKNKIDELDRIIRDNVDLIGKIL